MAAVTTAVVAGATGLAGLGMNIAQSVKAKKEMERSRNAQQMAESQIKNIKEQNAMAGVKVPTLGYELAQQGIERQSMAGIEAAQGAGAEGVIGALGNISGAANEANLQLGAQLGEKQFERDVMKAQMQQGINERKAEREFALGSYKLESEAAKEDAAQQRRNEAISGMFESVTGAISGIGGALGPMYGKGGGNRSAVPAGSTGAPAAPAANASWLSQNAQLPTGQFSGYGQQTLPFNNYLTGQNAFNNTLP